MRRLITALCGAAALAGCATTYDVAPQANGTGEHLRYDRGSATTFFELEQAAVQVTPLGFNSQRQITFGVAAFNKSSTPAEFGYENITLRNGAGAPIALYDRSTLERQAKNRAMIAAVAVAAAGGLSAYAASSNAYSSTNGYLSTPHGSYAFHTQTYDPALAYAATGAAVAATGATIASIDQRLNDTIANLNGRILARTTIDPGQTYGGTIVADRLKGPYPEDLILSVKWHGVEHDFHFRVAALH